MSVRYGLESFDTLCRVEKEKQIQDGKMAPKRQGKKVIGTVVRSTRKVVKETIEVSVVTAADSQLTQESRQEDQTFVETEEVDVPLEEPVKIIPVGGKVVAEGRGGRVIAVPVEGPKVHGSVEEPSRKEEGKDKRRSDVPTEEGESSEEEERRVDQTSDLSQEDHGLSKEEPGGDASIARAEYQEETSKEGAEEPGPGKSEATKRKKRTPEGKEGGRKRKRKRGTVEAGHGYRRYVYRVLKQVHPEMRVSSMAMNVINSLMNDMFERIADEAAKLSRYRERSTLSYGEIQGAVKLVLPGELGKHAIAEGSKAISNYLSYDRKKRRTN